MNIYQYTSNEMEILKLPNTIIPVDNSNSDYLEFLANINSGNIPYQQNSIPLDTNFSVTRRQLKQFLIESDLIDVIENYINSITDLKTNRIINNWWVESQTFERYHSVVINMSGKLGMTTEQIDGIFLASSML